MAGRMIKTRLRIVATFRWTIAGLCLMNVLIVPVYGEELPDPTRPPSSIFAPAAGVAARQPMQNLSSGLHTIIISKTRRAAIIDGQIVELGGEHGNARLVEVNEGGVVLQRAQGRQVLTLFPDVRITRRSVPDAVPMEPGKQSAEKKSSNE